MQKLATKIGDLPHSALRGFDRTNSAQVRDSPVNPVYYTTFAGAHQFLAFCVGYPLIILYLVSDIFTPPDFSIRQDSKNRSEKLIPCQHGHVRSSKLCLLHTLSVVMR